MCIKYLLSVKYLIVKMLFMYYEYYIFIFHILLVYLNKKYISRLSDIICSIYINIVFN
jgi:hypothetical protein